MLTNASQDLQHSRLGTAASRIGAVCGIALHKAAPRAVSLAAIAAVPALLAVTAVAQVPVPPPSLAGVWIDDTGQGAVEISPCGDRLCGRIVWLKAPTDRVGRPIVDDNNPDPARRRRPVCGLPVIGDLVRQHDGSWDRGWIYDPKVGKSYDVELRLNAPDRLRVTGYLGVKFLSETFVWTRAPAQLDRCRVPSQANVK